MSTESLTTVELDLIRETLFGSAKMVLKDALGQDTNTLTIRSDNDMVNAAYLELNPLYQKEFGISMLQFASLSKPIRDGYADRECSMLRGYIHKLQRSLLLSYDGKPSISFGLNPPTRLHIEDVALVNDSDIVLPS